MVELEGFRDAMREELEERAETFGRQTAEMWRDLANQHLLSATPPGTASQEEWNMQSIADSAEIFQEGEKWVVEWTATGDDGTPLAPIFEFGAVPHDIEGNPVLHWTDPETGEDVFRHKVRHPGIPAVAFIRFGKRRIETAVEQGDVEV